MILQTIGGSRGGKREIQTATGVLAALALTICGLLAVPAMASAAAEPGSIKGEVTDASTHAAIEGVEVCALEKEELENFNCTKTGTNGEYTLSKLPVGEYIVEFWTGTESLDYITQYYNAAATLQTAKAVAVTSNGIVSEVDAEMHKGGLIKGKLTGAGTHSGLAEIGICALAVRGERYEYVRCALSNSDGEYALVGLPTGEYKVEFTTEFTEEGENGYITQYYNDKPTLGQAEAIAVTAPNSVNGINAELQLASTLWPANIGAPGLSGTPMPGNTLFCSTGSWTNDPSAYSYKWLRNGIPLTGQTSSTFEVQGNEVGAMLACRVTAINGHGSGMATSNALQVQPLASIPPLTTPPPKVLKCRKGLRKKTVHGKERCVKARRRRGHRRH